MLDKLFTFEHVIPIEVYHKTDETNLVISVNNEIKFKKQYSKDKIYSETIKFLHNYNNGDKNTLSFDFQGNSETEKKYVKIYSIAINNIRLTLYNALYEPVINQEWWEQLTETEHEHYQNIIYGNNGNTFGWFGKIHFAYFTATARDKLSLDNKDYILNRITSTKTDVIYLDNKKVNAWDIQK